MNEGDIVRVIPDNPPGVVWEDGVPPKPFEGVIVGFEYHEPSDTTFTLVSAPGLVEFGALPHEVHPL